jgi:hypothetical protein
VKTKKSSPNPEAALETKVKRKASAAETSPEGIWSLIVANASTQDPSSAAKFLQSLFAKKKLGSEHADAMLALSMPFQGGSASPELLEPSVVLDLLQQAKFYCRGLDALVLLTYPRAKELFQSARAELPEMGRRILDAVRVRFGESVEPEVARALVLHFVEQIGVHLPTPDGRIRNAGALEVRETVKAIAPGEIWTDVYAAHFMKPGSYGMRPDVLASFDEATLVRVLLAVDHLRSTEMLNAFISLSPDTDALWAALDALTDPHKNPFHPGTYFTLSLLACLGALASKRHGKEVPASFESHVSRMIHGYPSHLPGLERFATFLLDAFRALGGARSAAFVQLSLRRDEERREKSLGPANLIEVVLGSIASGDLTLLTKTKQNLPSPHYLPPSIVALLA